MMALASVGAGRQSDSRCACCSMAASTISIMKGAYLEVWSDMLGSVGVLVAGAVIAWTGWTPIDPIVAIAISLWILPQHLDAAEGQRQHPARRRAERRGCDGDRASHCARCPASPACTICTCGGPSAVAMFCLDGAYRARRCRRCNPTAKRSAPCAALIAQRFGISHATLQLEHVVCVDGLRNVGSRVHRAWPPA